MFAQSLAEYGFAAAMARAVDQAWVTVSDIVANPDSRILYIVGFGILAWMSLRLFARR
jgi:hypothetical protein